MVYPRHCKCYAKAAFFLFKTSTRGCVRSPLRVATPTCRQNDQLRGYWAAMQFCFQACLSDMRNSRQENKACHAPDMREHCINIWGPHGQHPALAHKSSWGSGVFAATLADRNLTGGAGVSTRAAARVQETNLYLSFAVHNCGKLWHVFIGYHSSHRISAPLVAAILIFQGASGLSRPPPRALVFQSRRYPSLPQRHGPVASGSHCKLPVRDVTLLLSIQERYIQPASGWQAYNLCKGVGCGYWSESIDKKSGKFKGPNNGSGPCPLHYLCPLPEEKGSIFQVHFGNSLDTWEGVLLLSLQNSSKNTPGYRAVHLSTQLFKSRLVQQTTRFAADITWTMWNCGCGRIADFINHIGKVGICARRPMV
ncbi:hypothetical protein IF1G_03043 [Cordyceps javanica]|uniref:Uncharacterized protein n=1 Tax=Cordyceps javanica TaxID=43265 RepID=A0A545VB71_9HYPO|nr:hypothetical protein IF1G_03043 [Cordyceps javanica]